MLTPEEQMQILKGAITQGYKGPIYQLIDEANVQKGQTAQTENQHKQGLRGTDGNTAMSFPESDSNFTTEGMEFPIDIRKYNKEGNLVRSYNKVPPGIKELDMGEEEGTVIETPSQYKKGGFYKHGGTHPTTEESQNAFINEFLEEEKTNTTKTSENKGILANTVSTTDGAKYYNKNGSPMTFEEKNVKIASNKKETKKYVEKSKEDIKEFLSDPVNIADAVGATGIPIISEAGDLVSAGISHMRGDKLSRNLSLAGVITPFAGGAVFKHGVKPAYNVVNNARKVRLVKNAADIRAPGIISNADVGVKQITSREDLLKEYASRNNAYRTTNITGDVMKNEELLKQARHYGFDPNDPKQLAEFMGTTPTGGVGNRAGFSGVRGNSDVVYYGDLPGQTNSRYGLNPQQNAYTSKINIFEDDISKLSNDQIYDRISALDNTRHNDASMGIFNTSTDMQSLDKIPHGGVINTNTIHPPGISTTTQIVGRQNIPIRQSKGILSGDEIMELTNFGKDPFKTFQKGGLRKYQNGGGFYEHGGTHDKEITDSNNDVIYSGGMIPEVTISEKKKSGWENFEKSKVGEFVDAKGLRKEKDFWMKTFGYGEGEEKDAVMDAAATVIPTADFLHSATKFNEGKYLDAGLYAGFAMLPWGAGPLVKGTKKLFGVTDDVVKTAVKSGPIPTDAINPQAFSEAGEELVPTMTTSGTVQLRPKTGPNSSVKISRVEDAATTNADMKGYEQGNWYNNTHTDFYNVNTQGGSNAKNAAGNTIPINYDRKTFTGYISQDLDKMLNVNSSSKTARTMSGGPGNAPVSHELLLPPGVQTGIRTGNIAGSEIGPWMNMDIGPADKTTETLADFYKNRNGGLRKYDNGGIDLSVTAKDSSNCGSGTGRGCSRSEAPLSLQTDYSLNYNTGNKSIGAGIGAGLQGYFGGYDTREGAPIVAAGLRGKGSLVGGNFKGMQNNEEGANPEFKGELDLYGKVGFKKKNNWSSRNKSQRLGFEAGAYGNYDLLNSNIKEVGVYGGYGPVDAKLGYNLQDKSVKAGLGISFDAFRKTGGVRKHQKGDFKEKPKGIIESEMFFKYPSKRDDLKKEINSIVKLEKKSDRPKTKKLLEVSNFMENSMGNNKEAYGRTYTNSQASIDKIMLNDLFDKKRDEDGNETKHSKTQLKYFAKLKKAGLPTNKDEFQEELLNDNPKAAIHAMRMVYGKVPEAIPEITDTAGMFKYYNDHYRKNNKITDLTKSEERFYEGYGMEFKKGGYKSMSCW